MPTANAALRAAPPPRRPARVIEAYRPFPVEAIPNPARVYVEQCAQALGCDPAYPALPVLSVLASAIGNSRTIRLKRGWEEPSVVWSAIVGDSGTLKSPAYLKAVAHLLEIQRRHAATYRTQMRGYRAARRKADQGEGHEREEPVQARVVCSDITIETVAPILEDNPRGVLVARDELSGWLGSFARYRGKAGGSDMPNWLEMFRAGTVAVDRKTGERRTIYVSRAAVSVTGGIQPGVLARALGPESFDAGLSARLLMAMPPRKPKRWSEVEVDPEAEEAYHQLLDALLALEMRDLDGDRVPHALTLSPDAKALWVRFFDEWGQEQATVEGDLAAAYSKLEGYAARFALLHHVVTHVDLRSDDLRPVGPRSIEAGIQLARWFAGETRRIYATLAESTEERDLRRLVEFVQAHGGEMTARKLQRSNSRRYGSAAHAEAALESLASAGVGEWLPAPPCPKGGQPARIFVLRPTPDTTDTTEAGATEA